MMPYIHILGVLGGQNCAIYTHFGVFLSQNAAIYTHFGFLGGQNTAIYTHFESFFVKILPYIDVFLEFNFPRKNEKKKNNRDCEPNIDFKCYEKGQLTSPTRRARSIKFNSNSFSTKFYFRSFLKKQKQKNIKCL